MSNGRIISDLLADLPRGLHSECIGNPPLSYFHSPRDLAATESIQFEPKRNVQSKLLVGVVGGEAVNGPRSPDGRINRYVTGGIPIGLSDDRHHTVIAGSRAGKARSVLVPQLLTLPETVSVLALDVKAELSRLTAGYRANALRQAVRLFDPYEICDPSLVKYRIAFNPIDILLKSTCRLLVANARLIADALILTSDYEQARHWDDTARQICATLCTHVATFHRYSTVRDLVTVWRLASELAATDESGKFWLEQELISNDAAGGTVRLGAKQFYSRTGSEFSSCVSNVLRHLQWIGDPALWPHLSGVSIDLRDLKRRAMTLYVLAPAMRLAEFSPLQRCMLQLTLAAMEEEANATGKVGRRVYLLLDEFHTLGYLAAIETAAAQFASLATMVTVLQDLSQLKSKYPRSFETFIGNSGAVQCFGLADDTTLSYVAKRLGETTTLNRATTAPGFDQASQHAATGESWSTGVSPLLTPEEVSRYFARDDHQLRQLIIRPGSHPAILQRIFYDKHEIFRGRYAEPD